MAIKASDLSKELKREILEQLRDQLGDAQYKHYIETLGEDGLLTLFLESAENASHQNGNYSAATRKPDRKPLLEQVLLWTLIIGSYLGLGWILFYVVTFLYGLLLKSLKEAENLANIGSPQYYRTKKDNDGSDKDDSNTVIFFAALAGVILNWIILSGYRRTYLFLLIIIFGLNLFGQTLYRIIKFRDRKLLARGIVTLILLVLVSVVFWRFFPEASLAVINYFGSSNVGTILSK
jgi:hypothetical protein